MTFINVLLPAPFSPMSACTSPLRNSRLTPSSATVGPKRLWMLVRLSKWGLGLWSLALGLWSWVFGLSFQCIVQRLHWFYSALLIRTRNRHDPDLIVNRQR